MADIFLSYASTDRERAKQIAEALTSRGWSVWWDRNIPFGDNWDEIIEEQIDAARCIVVLWSQSSVKSTWVRNEAREAKTRGILIPALIEAVRPPLEFRHQQTANLVDWHPGAPQPEFDKLLAELGETLSPPTVTITPLTDDKHRVLKDPQEPMLESVKAAPRAKTRARAKATPRSRPDKVENATTEPRRWRAKLVESDSRSRMLRVTLTRETHVIFYCEHYFSQTVEVDDRVVAEGGTALTQAREFKFKLSDGTTKYPALLEVDCSFLQLTKGVRLTVGGQLLYRDGTL